ncbi:MAG: hypothetical protein M0T84_00700 [Betaproteobacteria bacterium]|nr:hypothetical protein [Betaproteobacteria bacterium]
MRDKNPLQMKFEYALWTIGIIREVIRKRFDVRLSVGGFGGTADEALGLHPPASAVSGVAAGCDAG